MALSKQVAESMIDAQGNLRNALAFAARSERPMMVSVIADLIQRIDSVMSTDDLLDRLDERMPGSSDSLGSFFDPDKE